MSGVGGDPIRFEEQGLIIPPGGIPASDIAYIPANPADWIALGLPVPTRINEADDGLAAVLAAGAPSIVETAGTAIAIGDALYRAGTGRMLLEDATFLAIRDAFAGFGTTAAAADGDPVQVAGNGARATGLVGVVVGEGYYISGNVLIPESGLAAFLAGATPGDWYRFVGTGDSTSSIKQAWGEPLQVTGP